jgi:type IV secretory pathway VirB9-like protein
MKIYVPALALLLATTASAQTDKTGIKDIRLTTLGTMVIDTQLRYVTTLVLPDGEEAMDIVAGDPDFWDIHKVAANKVSIKPAKEGAESNVTVFGTSGRIYPFIVRESKTRPKDVVVTVSLDESLSTTTPKYVAAERLLEMETQLAESAQRQAAAIAAAEEHLATGKAQYPSELRFLWQSVPYTPPFKVRSVFTDGKFTFIRIDAKEMPALYEFKDGKESLIVPDVPQPGLLRVQKVLDSFYLSLGKARQQVALLKDAN